MASHGRRTRSHGHCESYATFEAEYVDADDGASSEEDADIPPPVEKVEVAKYFTEFTRQGPYPYQICAELPGEIGDPDTILTARSARCIPVEAGELESG